MAHPPPQFPSQSNTGILFRTDIPFLVENWPLVQLSNIQKRGERAVGEHLELPKVSVRNEEHDTHLSASATPTSGSLAAKVSNVLDVSSNITSSKVDKVKVEGLSLEMQTVMQGFDKPTCEKIGSIPEVEEYMRGYLRPDIFRRPVFIVTSLLIAKNKPKITSLANRGTFLSSSANASSATTAEALVTVEGHGAGGNSMTEEGCYTGDMGVIVGYEVDIVRPGLNGLEAEGYMDGAEFACVNAGETHDDGDERKDGEDDDDKLRCLPLTIEELENIPHDNSRFSIENLGEGHFWIEFLDNDTNTSLFASHE
ncbi:unnamed protein product [Clonostachys rosea]|uniref:Uncharacterized protein n=1 Tax=Bionectria ochroleuca TaxID=29856 RepID=A0ABY6V4D7_BIOOC|nr:unnamed protein product [Clonostachys rosea]